MPGVTVSHMVEPILGSNRLAAFDYKAIKIKGRRKKSTKDRDQGPSQKLGTLEPTQAREKEIRNQESALYTVSAQYVHESVNQGADDDTTQWLGTEGGCAQLALARPFRHCQT